MKLRTAVLVLAGLGAPLALLFAALPITWGWGGYDGGGKIVYVDPLGPAYRAGLRQGDRTLPPRGKEAIDEDAGNTGTIANVRVVRKNGDIRTLKFAFVPFSGALAFQQQLNKVLSALTALAAFIIAIIVVLRARDQRVGTRAASVLLLAGAGAFCEALALVCGNAWIGMLYWVSPLIFFGATIWAVLHLLAIYPPNQTRIRTTLGKLSVLPLAWGIFTAGAWSYDNWNGTLIFRILAASWVNAIDLLLLVMIAIAIIDGMATAGAAYATAMRWLGSMWLLAIALAAVPVIARLANAPILGYSHYGDLFQAGMVFCLAFGVAYPVLRHRLVDLNILVSRASVFGIVSAIIVGIFIAAEWAIGKVFEQGIGLPSQRGGLAAQLLALAVVLVLGISARSIHAFVEERMSKTFFRKRMRGLAQIQRVAQEADAATDAHAIVGIAVSTVYNCLEPLGVALFLHVGDTYERSASAGALAFPATYAFNDEPLLRLRRWQEPFEIDDDSSDRHHMLFVPMTLRGEVLGFLCSGPKPDRTAYLPDEIAALTNLAHHVGIATAMLGRMHPASALTLVAT